MKHLFTISFDLHYPDADDYERAWKILEDLGCFRHGRSLAGGQQRGPNTICWREQEIAELSSVTVISSALLAVISKAFVDAGIDGFRLSVSGGTPESLIIVDRPATSAFNALRRHYNPFSSLGSRLPSPSSERQESAMLDAFAEGTLTHRR